jgi:hypothetical protein
VRREHAGIHDIDDASGAGVAAVILPVEISVELIDPIEMPEYVDVRIIPAAGEARRHVHCIEGDIYLATIGRHKLGVGRSQWNDRGHKNSAGE